MIRTRTRRRRTPPHDLARGPVMGVPGGDFLEFRARPPWWGGDLQTLRDWFLSARAAAAPAVGERLSIPADDGSDDILSVNLHRGGGGGGRPVVLLWHGLTGDEASASICHAANYFLACGAHVARVNLRGAGPSRNTCRGYYHAGFGQDIGPVLAGVRAALGDDAGPALGVGVSLGGSILLNYLAATGEDAGLVAAATISAPIDLAGAAERLIQPRNWPYHRRLLAGMKSGAVAGAAAVSEAERAALDSARNIVEYDDRFIARRFGFAGAAGYYAACSANRKLDRITRPCILIHAADDPWIPARAYQAIAWPSLPAVRHVMAAGGGHVGFHGRGARWPWSLAVIGRFFGEAAGLTPP